ncbi:winged helix-turn-helix transcriptional regulator [Solirubrum puertoriconensis]|uniref:HxlR family transcriptional regulator n=1 Tax=Solirubrum puertoriconensis TaxID=1751427 RepID=A0A9X0HLX3_SOLP1|nr:helix-turn-helix domain-containing protein [Solirubrum puertoriconensis]KUG08249.1 HxlR family transcriptional regulator [Solirubrum puertoriconensis]
MSATKTCTDYLRPLRDAMDVLGGKWKIPVIMLLSVRERRFKEIQRELGVAAKVLSKELKELESHELVKRTVFDTVPLAVEYSLTDYGRTLEKVIGEIRDWGVHHRERILERV